jgi:hypothetical protein
LSTAVIVADAVAVPLCGVCAPGRDGLEDLATTDSPVA